MHIERKDKSTNVPGLQLKTTGKTAIMEVSPNAGKPAEPEMLVNVPKLVTAYFSEVPDPSVAEQRVLFGTSGHRGSSFKNSFNENHILAITQAICLYRLNRR